MGYCDNRRSCSDHPVRKVPSVRAKEMYDKLRPLLNVVEAIGCQVPRRYSKIISPTGIHASWPIHYWAGPGKQPLILEWNHKGTQRPTFQQFCLAYGFRLTENDL